MCCRMCDNVVWAWRMASMRFNGVYSYASRLGKGGAAATASAAGRCLLACVEPRRGPPVRLVIWFGIWHADTGTSTCVRQQPKHQATPFY
jgi:hypothetical protein